jgi:hypothetical protein
MGLLHAAYGACFHSYLLSALSNPYAGTGALCAPLVSTQFSHLRHWSFHYFVSLGIAISNMIILATVFGFRTQDGEQLRVKGAQIYGSNRMPRGNRASVYCEEYDGG